MRDQLIDLMVERLNGMKDPLKKQFFMEHSIKVARHFVLDDFLPLDVAEKIHAEFPPENKMRMLNIGGQAKLKYSVLKNTSPLLQDLHFAIQSPQVISVVEEITEIKNQVPDPSHLAGGISRLLKGHYINPHLDHSHDVDKKLYRAVNMLYYLSPEWKVENGGNFELWDEAIQNRIIVPSFFNRLVVMATNQTSWHSVNPVVCNKARCCVFNYYFSEQSPEGEDYYHGTSSPFFNPLIRPRPEQKISRMVSKMKCRLFGRPW
jgi:Rps23 Pro-64 3,4-dihydroxylase Tpa1-like proline 4-hydroxylase